MQLLWPANHNALSQGPDEQITIYFSEKLVQLNNFLVGKTW